MNCKACGRKPNLKHCLGNYLEGKRNVTKHTVNIMAAAEHVQNVSQKIYT